jgi:hypothetical protein
MTLTYENTQVWVNKNLHIMNHNNNNDVDMNHDNDDVTDKTTL